MLHGVVAPAPGVVAPGVVWIIRKYVDQAYPHPLHSEKRISDPHHSPPVVSIYRKATVTNFPFFFLHRPRFTFDPESVPFGQTHFWVRPIRNLGKIYTKSELKMSFRLGFRVSLTWFSGRV